MNDRRDVTRFDAAEYLDSPETIAAYLTAAAEEGNDMLIAALDDVARAIGMAQVARDAGLGRESLYKALDKGSTPRFDTVTKVARAMRVKIVFVPVETDRHEEDDCALA